MRVGEKESVGDEERSEVEFSDINQLDGNISMSLSVEETEPLRVPVWCGHRPLRPAQEERRVSVRRTVRRDNRLVEALSLPSFTGYNMRSARAKLRSLGEDMEMRETDLSFLCEVWEREDSKDFQDKVEEVLEMTNIHYISNPRRGNRRGGGVGIAYTGIDFNITKLNIPVEQPLEIVWALLRSTQQHSKIRKIILISFYSPPRFGRHNQTLIDHIFINLNKLRILHPGSGTIMVADVNNLKVERILSMDPSLKSINKKPTRKEKCLDVVITDLHRFFEVPDIIPPVPVDRGEKGVPSDHMGTFTKPRSNHTKPPQNNHKTIQPMPNSLMEKYNITIAREDWRCLMDDMTSTEMVDLFEKKSREMTDAVFPLRKVLVKEDDKPHFNEKLRLLKRQRQRIYRKEGKSLKYVEKKKEFKEKEKKEARKYKERVIEEVKSGKRGSSYKAIRKLGDGPSDLKGKTFYLQSHLDQSLTPQQSAEKLADHFSALSQELSPINEEEFFPALREEIQNGRKSSSKPVLEEYQVYNMLKHIKMPSCSVPGDVPRKLMKEFTVDFVSPICKIYNNITQSAEYPRQWVKEYATIIPKCYETVPESESDLRNLGITSFLSKGYESFLCDWLWPYIEPHLDPGQWGGRKHRSTTHYMIKLCDFIHVNLDKSTPHAVAAGLIDLSRAYNRISHQQVMEDFHAMHVPGFLQAILVSYLTSRKLIVRHNGAISSPRTLNSGATQGARAGNIIFLVKFNGALLRPLIPRPIGNQTNQQPDQSDQSAIRPISKNKVIQEKYIDDQTVAASINLRKSLTQETEKRPFPLNFHERFGLKIKPSENLLQYEMDRFHTFANANNLKVNEKKTFVMFFNKSRTLDYPVEYQVGDSDILSEKSSTKLLGVILSNTLNFEENTQYIVRRASRKLWLLRRLKQLGLDEDTTLQFWTAECRPRLEYMAPLWTGSLSVQQSRSIDSVQRTALAICQDAGWGLSYRESLVRTGLDRLDTRRETLARRWGEGAAKYHSQTFFKSNPNKTRGAPRFIEPACRTRRRRNSAIPYITRLLNQVKK